MMSVASHPSILVEDGHGSHGITLNELGDLHHAIQPITELLCRASPNEHVRLHCTVPTWTSSSNICHDMHDLHDLRTRSLHFIHDLIKSLHAVGVTASYTLTPSDSPLCLVCASHAQIDRRKMQLSAFEALKVLPNVREKVLLIDLKDGPALVVT